MQLLCMWCTDVSMSPYQPHVERGACAFLVRACQRDLPCPVTATSTVVACGITADLAPPRVSDPRDGSKLWLVDKSGDEFCIAAGLPRNEMFWLQGAMAAHIDSTRVRLAATPTCGLYAVSRSLAC
jgi:hypothetical protein